MGIFTDLANSSSQIAPVGSTRVGLDRSSAAQLLAAAELNDPNPVAPYAAQNEVSVIPEQTGAGTGDTYTITVDLFRINVSFTTAAIAFNAVDTTIESAIDTAATGVVPGWTNGDISVTMSGAAGLDDGSVTLTFDGVSVAGEPATVSITPTGFTQSGTITRTTKGQPDRKAVQALFELNVVSGTLHDLGVAPTDWVRPGSKGQTRPRADLIKALALITIEEEGAEDAYNAVASLYLLPR